MTTRRRAAFVDHPTASRRLRRLLLGATILGGALPLAAQAQTTLPSGGNVVAGQATIGSAGSTMTIRQGSDRAIIDWADFSIGEKADVLIQNGSGATLNRVSGSAVSSIDGLLRATGSVYLVNPNGVVIGARGIVETGGNFIASTLDTPNAAFLAGGSLTFSGTSRAKVVNLGKVGALGGHVALIGALVENQGSLSAANGTVGMIAGSKVLLRDAAHDGGGLFSVLYGDAQMRAANGGTIAAANVELRAQQGNVYALAGNSAGTINATGVRRGDGRVWLVSDAGGTEVAGTIRARGADGAAGAIETSGARLRIGASTIDATGGTWLVDPEDLDIDAAAASTINATLGANTGVTLTTGASGASAFGNGDANGAGDILINAGLAWNTGATLTLSAYHGIAVNADIAVNRGGSVVLRTNQGGTGGQVLFTQGRSIAFADGQPGQALSINDVAYTLLYSWSDLQGINAKGGNYALAHRLSGRTTTSAPVQTLYGVLDGLGNTIENVTIRSTNATNVGLIGFVNGGAAVRNLVLGTVAAVDWAVKGSSQMGGLAGTNNGTIENIFGDVQAVTGDGDNVGGLVGLNNGDIRNVSVRADATGNHYVGGLVGKNTGRIAGAHVMSAADTWGAYHTGGLVGYNDCASTISNSSASVPVVGNFYYLGTAPVFTYSARVSGLVGTNYGHITQSFATGTVRGSTNVGGLVGQNLQGTIELSYATGAITASQYAGGLVGYNDFAGTIRNAYATGSVTADQMAGGLVGATDGAVSFVYASGKVTAKDDRYAGGVAGSAGTLEQARWDIDGTGQRAVSGDFMSFGATVFGVHRGNCRSREISVGGISIRPAARTRPGASMKARPHRYSRPS
jgi:filamentous hemagglutinin family protein